MTICNPERVALCAYGCGAFLSSLETIDNLAASADKSGLTNTARSIAASSFAQLIMALREQGKEVVFTDFYHNSGEVWKMVNEMLLMYEHPPIFQVREGKTEGSIGQGWAQSTDLLVNAWDPDAILGNKGESDPTADGQYGRRSTMQFIHFIASQHHNKAHGQPVQQENCIMM